MAYFKITKSSPPGPYSGTESGDYFSIQKPGRDAATVPLDQRKDVIDARAGDDTVTLSLMRTDRALDQGWVVYGGDGQDTITLGESADIMFGEAGNDTLSGKGGNDSMDGGDGDDTLLGGFGNDTMLGGAGSDTLSAGEGDDIVDGGDGDDSVIGSGGNNVLRGGAGNDQIVSMGGIDLIEGGDGVDEISSGAGNDTVNAGAGDDEVNAGAGNDVVRGGADDDSLGGGDGDDQLYGDAGDDTFTGGLGADGFDGGEGSDTVSYAGSTLVQVDLTTGATAGAAAGDTFLSIDNLIGSSVDDVLIGNDVANDLRGGDGADQIAGHGGDDALFGDLGIDLLLGEDGNDFLAGGDGADNLLGGVGRDVIRGGVGADTINGGTDFDAVDYRDMGTGVTLEAATVGGAPGFVELLNGVVNDVITGCEYFIGSDYDDVMTMGSGSQRLISGDGVNTLRGGTGVDQLVGTDGVNNLFGNAVGDAERDQFVALGGTNYVRDYQFATSQGQTVAYDQVLLPSGTLTGRGYTVLNDGTATAPNPQWYRVLQSVDAANPKEVVQTTYVRLGVASVEGTNADDAAAAGRGAVFNAGAGAVGLTDPAIWVPAWSPDDLIA